MGSFQTGLTGLDRDIGYFAEGNLTTVVSALDGEASVLVVNMLRHMVFEADARALVLLPGHSADVFEQRLRGACTGVPHQAVADGRLSDRQRTALDRYAKRRAEAPLTVATPRQVYTDGIDDAIDPYGPQDVIVVDAVQMLESVEPGFTDWGEQLPKEPREVELSKASRALKHLAIRYQATVIAVGRHITKHTPDAERLLAVAENSAAAFEAFLQDSDLVLEVHVGPSRGPRDTRRGVLIRKNRWGRDKQWVSVGIEHETSTVIDFGSPGRGSGS